MNDFATTPWLPVLASGLGFVVGGLLKPLMHRVLLLTTSHDDATSQQSTLRVSYAPIAICNALLWGGCALYWPTWSGALAWAVFGSFLLALAWIDWQTTLLPDMLTQPLLWCGLIASAEGWIHTPLDQAVWGSVLGYVSLWLTASLFEHITGKVGMGGGDFKLLAALGAWLGAWALWPLLFIASTSGALVGLYMQRRQTLREGRYLPFGPFLAAGGLAVSYGGASLLNTLLGA